MLTAGEVAGLIAAMAWAILVSFMAVVMVRLARLLTETTKMVSQLGDRVVPLLEDVSAAVGETNRQLVAIEAITKDVKQVSGHVAKVSDVTQSLVTGPMIKVAALAHGVRGALGARRRARPAAPALERRPR
jgi:ABC-type transporter Mla subunit MlaD